MGKIKHTKNELKAQKEALARFERFLPMLQLKKQQLQVEIQRISAAVEEKRRESKRLEDGLRPWIALFSEPVDLPSLIALTDISLDRGNIAGVSIPLLKGLTVERCEYDLFSTPPWLDDGLDTLDALIHLRVEREALEEQLRLVQDELRITTQRVNLFEKVKIPECRENIRVIKIFLGEEQTAAVVRGKLAKRLTQAAA